MSKQKHDKSFLSTTDAIAKRVLLWASAVGAIVALGKIVSPPLQIIPGLVFFVWGLVEMVRTFKGAPLKCLTIGHVLNACMVISCILQIMFASIAFAVANIGIAPPVANANLLYDVQVFLLVLAAFIWTFVTFWAIFRTLAFDAETDEPGEPSGIKKG